LQIDGRALDIHVIPPGINTQIFRTENTGSVVEQETHASLRSAMEHQIPQERRGVAQIVGAARLNPKKNVARMVEMFATSPRLQERANLVLMLTGGPDAFVDPVAHFKPGSEELAVASAVAEFLTDPQYGLAGKVLVPGLDNTQLQWAATARFPASVGVPGVFLHGALEEPFGLMLLEAGVSGLAVAATNVGGPVESLEHGRSGNLFNPHSVKEMEAAVWDLVGEWDGQNFPARWTELHDNVIARVQSTYSWDAAGREYAKLIYPGLGLELPSWLSSQATGHTFTPTVTTPAVTTPTITTSAQPMPSQAESSSSDPESSSASASEHGNAAKLPLLDSSRPSASNFASNANFAASGRWLRSGPSS
ncbi:MAG: glycosyltransferase, partial [Angustibacter sp.]